MWLTTSDMARGMKSKNEQRRIVIPTAKSSPANAIHPMAVYVLNSIWFIVSIIIELRHERRLCSQDRNYPYISKLTLVAEMFLSRKWNWFWAWFSNKSCKNFGSRCAKYLTYIFLYKSTELKNFCISCIVSTLDAYYIADTKSMKGTRYNSCSLLGTNLYYIPQLRTFSSRHWRVQWNLWRQNERMPS